MDGAALRPVYDSRNYHQPEIRDGYGEGLHGLVNSYHSCRGRVLSDQAGGAGKSEGSTSTRTKPLSGGDDDRKSKRLEFAWRGVS
jgi:hypothetical protein